MIANTNQLGGAVNDNGNGQQTSIFGDVVQKQEHKELKEGERLLKKELQELNDANKVNKICTLIDIYHKHFDNYVEIVNELSPNLESYKSSITELHSSIIDKINQIINGEEILEIMTKIYVIDNDDINDDDDIIESDVGGGKQIGGGLIDKLKNKIISAIAPPKVLPINVVTHDDDIIKALAIKKITCISLKSTDTYMQKHDFSYIYSHSIDNYCYCYFYMRKHPFSNIKVDVDDKFEISLIDIGEDGSGVATNKEIQFNLILTRDIEDDEVKKETYIFNTKPRKYITDKLQQILDAVKEEKKENNKQINDVQIPDIRASLQKIITFMPELLLLASADIILKIANNQIKNLFQTSACQQFTQYQRGTCWMCSVLNAIVLQDMNSIDIKIKKDIQADIKKVKQTFNVNTFIRQYVQILKPYFNLIKTDLDSGGWPIHTYYNITENNRILNLSLKPIDIMKIQPFDYLKPGIYFLYTLKHAAVFYILDNFLYYLIDSHLNIPCIPYHTCDSNMSEKISIGKVFCIYEAKPKGIEALDSINEETKLAAIKTTHKLLFNKYWARKAYFVTFKEYFEYQQYSDRYNDKNINLTLDEPKKELKTKLLEIISAQPGIEYGNIVINTTILYNKVPKITSLDIYNSQETSGDLHLDIKYIMNETTGQLDIDIDKTLKFDIRDYLFHGDDVTKYESLYVGNIQKILNSFHQRGSGRKNKYKVYKLNGNYYALYKNRKIIITRLNILDKIERDHISKN